MFCGEWEYTLQQVSKMHTITNPLTTTPLWWKKERKNMEHSSTISFNFDNLMKNRYIFCVRRFLLWISFLIFEIWSSFYFLAVFEMYICASCSRKDWQDSLPGIKGSQTHKPLRGIHKLRLEGLWRSTKKVDKISINWKVDKNTEGRSFYSCKLIFSIILNIC